MSSKAASLYAAAKFWLGNFGYIAPKMETESIAYLDVKRLHELGIRGVILDVDNTMTRFHGTSVDEAVTQNLERIKSGFATCIISNSTTERRRKLEDYFGLPVVQSSVKKPNSEPFYEALKLLGTDASETCMIGDRLLTDIAGANRAKIYSIKVPALHLLSEPPTIWMARTFEQLMLRESRS